MTDDVDDDAAEGDDVKHVRRTLYDYWLTLRWHLSGGWRDAGEKLLNSAVLMFGGLPLGIGDALWWAWGRWQRLL